MQKRDDRRQGRAGYVVIALALLVAGTKGAEAKESCWREGPNQFADATHYCVSSVLAPQGRRDYGPKNLVGFFGTVGAWCEGAKGNGIGETITIRIERGPAFRRLLIKNGYSRSKKAYRDNGRLKRVRLTTDTGIDANVMLPDSAREIAIQLPKVAPHRWIRLEILDIYPGARFQDTCVSALGPDFVHEEELLAGRQNMAPERPSQALQSTPPPAAKPVQKAEPVDETEPMEKTRPASTSDKPPDIAATTGQGKRPEGEGAASVEAFDIDAAIALSRNEPPQTEDAELALWNSIKLSEKPADLENYLDKYPSGTFVKIAKHRLQQIGLQQQAAASRR